MVEVKHVTKRYGGITVVDDVSLSIKRVLLPRLSALTELVKARCFP